jgi:cell division protease FtsH
MVFWVVMFLMVLALFNLFSSPPGATGGDARSFSTFVEVA